jgi:transposase
MCGRYRLSRRKQLVEEYFDCDPWDEDWSPRYNIAPTQPPTQDGRPLRRYRKHWRVERLFAWLHDFRRLVIRWEYHVENFFGMVHLGCMQILFRHLSDQL